MNVRRFVAVWGAVAIAASALSATAAADGLDATPVTRLPFPERGYIVDLPLSERLEETSVRIRENGVPVERVRVSPIAASGLRFGVVLAVDASETMTGRPFAAAMDAARAFAAHRKRSQHVGLVSFNGEVSVLVRPTRDAAALAAALGTPPELAYGTRMYDAVHRSLGVLRAERMSAGSIVLLSDGADLRSEPLPARRYGSMHGLDEVVAAARRQRVRIFTVGLRSTAFDAAPLRDLAAATGGSYTEATSTAELRPIFDALGRRLASEYLVRYRSDARPESHVRVAIGVAGVGERLLGYVAPTPSRVDPFQRGFLTRFLLSPASLALVVIAFAGLVGFAIVLLAHGPKRTHVARINQFSRAPARSTAPVQAEPSKRQRRAARYTDGWWARLERDLEIARMTKTPRQIAALTGTASFLVAVVLLFVSPLLALLGLLAPPAVARSVIRWKLRRVRDAFADELPAALQVLASALRAGHSFTGALTVMVENAGEPARSEFRRVAQDEQLGAAPEVAIRRMGDRMANRDLEQVALLAELQRTSGGNSAEVLDTVVETIRQRGELRRLVRSLTAQGRLARWILTALPIAMTAFLWFMQPDIMGSFFRSGTGQAALAAAILMVVAGSLLIQRIIDIEV